MTTPPLRRLQRLAWLFFAVAWVALAVDPKDRADWALENVLVGLLGVVMVIWRNRLTLSPLSSILLCAFLCLHSIGAHYTYSLVPYDAWFQALTSSTLSELLGWERNHYDRLVHFSAGALLVVPLRELWLKRTPRDEAGAGFVALLVVMAGSLVYELIEWLAAVVVGGDLGAAYLGTQGDEWDAHKDMALATVGAVLTLLLSRLARRRPPNETDR